MRDIKRIKRILKLIEKIWLDAPDQRLGQLLENYAGFKSGVNWNAEDDDTEMWLETNIKVFEMQEHYTKTGQMLCLKCKTPFKKISEHTFKPDCEHYNKELRLSVG